MRRWLLTRLSRLNSCIQWLGFRLLIKDGFIMDGFIIDLAIDVFSATDMFHKIMQCGCFYNLNIVTRFKVPT